MGTRANKTDFLKNYRMADPDGRLEIVFANYHIFPKVIRKIEKRTQYKIKAEREYLRSHARGELGVRVQISSFSDVTADEAIANVILEEAFRSGVMDAGMLKGIDNAVEYEADIRIICIMKDDYELVEECVEDMDDTDSQLLKEYLLQRKFFKELACDFNLSYDTVKRRIKALKELVRNDVIDCIEMNCRK